MHLSAICTKSFAEVWRIVHSNTTLYVWKWVFILRFCHLAIQSLDHFFWTICVFLYDILFHPGLTFDPKVSDMAVITHHHHVSFICLYIIWDKENFHYCWVPALQLEDRWADLKWGNRHRTKTHWWLRIKQIQKCFKHISKQITRDMYSRYLGYIMVWSIIIWSAKYRNIPSSHNTTLTKLNVWLKYCRLQTGTPRLN